MNFFAVALAGCRTGPVEIALRSLAEFSGGRQATFIGRTERIDALSAAFLNAAGANVHDFCDTHLRTVIHPTAPVAPALLALAELRQVSGADCCSPSSSATRSRPASGSRSRPAITARAGTSPRPAACSAPPAAPASCSALDERQMVWALGNAATQSAGLCECLGTPAKSVSVGNAARNGLWSALLAEKGFDGPPEPLAGVQGFYHAMGETPDLSLVTDGLGESWEIMATSYKPYPCGFVIHPVLDCVLDWRRDNPEAEVARVVVRGNPLLSDRTDRPDISTGREVAGQRAARGRRRAGDRQGRARSVHRRLRARSRGAGAAQQGRSGARSGVLHHRGRGRNHHRRRQDPKTVASRRRAAATSIR